ncbi:MAG: redoxin family protein [Porticoccaceae bacterium]|jgi:peroxiredoxin|nr:redoxin family protein [Porticoccaceae bacterium]HLS97713.1 redoxin family protein [Porticoccaceae bacterium]
MTTPPKAPELITAEWFNTEAPPTLAALDGRVVVVLAFQMLCPGCVAEAIPRAKRLRRAFAPEDVAVIGLHTVFEHHGAMTPVSLAAFLHEYRVEFPVAVDRPASAGPVPETMALYGMRGTPTWLLIDRQGRLRRQYFGHAEDMLLGAEVMALVRD